MDVPVADSAVSGIGEEEDVVRKRDPVDEEDEEGLRIWRFLLGRYLEMRVGKETNSDVA